MSTNKLNILKELITIFDLRVFKKELAANRHSNLVMILILVKYSTYIGDQFKLFNNGLINAKPNGR